MTASAWTLMGVTWAVIAYFTVRFFLAVLRTTEREDGTDT